MMVIGWVIEIQDAASLENESYYNFLEFLANQDSQWNENSDPNALNSPTYVTLGTKRYHSYRTTVLYKRWSIYSWAIVSTLTFFVRPLCSFRLSPSKSLPISVRIILSVYIQLTYSSLFLAANPNSLRNPTQIHHH